MRLRAFDLNEPVPELNGPHALAIIQPWTDVSSVGTLILYRLEAYLGAKEQTLMLNRPMQGSFIPPESKTFSRLKGDRPRKIHRSMISG